MAAENVTITAPAGSTRTYDVYQIFTGDLSGNVLSNVKWGENGTGKAGEAVAKEALDAFDCGQQPVGYGKADRD